MTAQQPLVGLRVLALGQSQPIQACTRLLQRLGATVALASALPACPSTNLTLLDENALSDRCLSEALQQLLPAGCVAVAVTPFGLDYLEDSNLEEAADWLGPTVASELAAAHAVTVGLAVLRYAARERCSLVVDLAVCELPIICLGDALPPAVCPRATGPTAVPERSQPVPKVVVLDCADGSVALSGLTSVGRGHLAALSGVDAVMDERSDLADALRPWASVRTRQELFESAQLWRIPLVPALTADEASGWAGASTGGPFRVRGWSTDPSRPGENGSDAIHSAALPLSDVRVLDLGSVWAGPYGARLLAALGAEVVKIEAPNRPDGTRPASGGGCAGVFADLNRGKRSLPLDLARLEGREVFLRLARRADVLIENFSRRVMPNFDLDDATLAIARPALVHVSLPAFPSDGPWADYVAYGSGLELMAGLGAAGPDGIPRTSAVPYLDYLSGAYGAVAALAWLYGRDATGEGAHVEVPQWEVARGLLEAAPAGASPGARFVSDPGRLVVDPSITTRGLLAVAQPENQPCRHLARAPWLVRGWQPPDELPAPGFGAQTREVLREWDGSSVRGMEQLIESGVAVDASSGGRPSPQPSPQRGEGVDVNPPQHGAGIGRGNAFSPRGRGHAATSPSGKRPRP